MAPPSLWLDSLADVVIACISAHSLCGPLGYRYREEAEVVEFIAYPTPIELVGGEEDGTVVSPGFSLDVQQLMATFEHIVAVHWVADGYGPYDLEGPLLSIEGDYQGHPVWLRVLMEAPADEPPGMKLDTLAQHSL